MEGREEWAETTEGAGEGEPGVETETSELAVLFEPDAIGVLIAATGEGGDECNKARERIGRRLIGEVEMDEGRGCLSASAATDEATENLGFDIPRKSRSGGGGKDGVYISGQE